MPARMSRRPDDSTRNRIAGFWWMSGSTIARFRTIARISRASMLVRPLTRGSEHVAGQTITSRLKHEIVLPADHHNLEFRARSRSGRHAVLFPGRHDQFVGIVRVRARALARVLPERVHRRRRRTTCSTACCHPAAFRRTDCSSCCRLTMCLKTLLLTGDRRADLSVNRSKAGRKGNRRPQPRRQASAPGRGSRTCSVALGSFDVVLRELAAKLLARSMSSCENWPAQALGSFDVVLRELASLVRAQCRIELSVCRQARSIECPAGRNICTGGSRSRLGAGVCA